MRAEIKELRKVIGEKIYVKVMMVGFAFWNRTKFIILTQGSNKVASHLLEKRRRIGEHQKKQREDAAIKRPSDCDEYDEPKSKIQKIEKTENKQWDYSISGKNSFKIFIFIFVYCIPKVRINFQIKKCERY